VDTLPSIFNLVSDIKALFTRGHKPSSEVVEALGADIASIVADRMIDAQVERQPTIRMSNIGKKDRQIWYDFHHKQPREQLSAQARIKFLYGDILERLLIFWAKEAGHDVKDVQQEVEVDGIKGHLDAVIDDVVVDAKSCSSYAFKKFEEGTLKNDDPFGYMHQVGGYSEAKDGADGAFLAIDKTTGNITLLPVPRAELAALGTRDRIRHLRNVVASLEPPPKCYQPKDFGQSGNKILPIGCSYCDHKFECHADTNGGKGLRVFLYSDGPKFFTEVKREPQVPELTKKE
jgi:hypothetical protein